MRAAHDLSQGVHQSIEPVTADHSGRVGTLMGRRRASRVRELLDAFSSVSVERMMNDEYVFAREEDDETFIDSCRVAGLPACMLGEEIGDVPVARHA